MSILRRFFAATALSAGVIVGGLGVAEFSLDRAIKTSVASVDNCRNSLDGLCSFQTMFNAKGATSPRREGIPEMCLGAGLLAVGIFSIQKREEWNGQLPNNAL